MKCIFCLEDRDPSDEHLFPESIGGSFVINRVCKCCNDKLGSEIEAPFINSWPIQIIRRRLNILGGSKNLPNPFGDGVLVDHDNRKVRTDYDRVSGSLRTKLLPAKPTKSMNDNGASYEISIDSSDTGPILDGMIKSIFCKEGLPEPQGERLQRVKTKLLEHAKFSEFESPLVQQEVTIDFTKFPKAFTKIAYELAWYWLGENFIDDPRAISLRRSLGLFEKELAAGHNQNIGGDFKVWPSDLNSPFSLLGNATGHLGFAMRVKPGIIVGVRVFDVCTLSIAVTANPERYPDFAFDEADGPCMIINQGQKSPTHSSIQGFITASYLG